MQNLKEVEKCANFTNVYFRGCKIGGVRIGKWDYIINGESIFGGNYNYSGQKVGIWIEPDKNYEKNLITFSGEYREDIKVGIWNTLLKEQIIEGGGQYNEKGQKQGMWIEVQNKTTQDFLLFYKGNYKKGRRVKYWKWTLDNKTIGYGEYNDNGYKDKFWIEVDKNYSNRQENKFQKKLQTQILRIIQKWNENKGLDRIKLLVVEGYILMNSKKMEFGVNQQKILVHLTLYSKQALIHKILKLVNGIFMVIIQECQFQIINNSGGGKYDKRGLKQGDWIDVEIIDAFWEMLSSGFYENGVRILQWKFKLENQLFQCMYNQIGQKQNYWIEFLEGYDENQIQFEGNYKKGKRYGLWKIIQENQIIGSGLYDENGQKFGLWKELHPRYSLMGQLMMKGEYLNGVKINYWQIVTQKENYLIGCGSFNEKGQKIGKWRELHQYYPLEQQIEIYNSREIISCGSYVDGLKIGIWEDIRLDQILIYSHFDKEGKGQIFKSEDDFFYFNK
ncbi:unnamed protein product [Paramecium primaurelia]|uniref:Uncharacterized protein n=1 Tax=Paramecium primaurelia TaxID=5886 RepID=A0A8S1PM82_PARPR|nr:unnamed protein product [Paramecium primaurelia]